MESREAILAEKAECTNPEPDEFLEAFREIVACLLALGGDPARPQFCFHGHTALHPQRSLFLQDVRQFLFHLIVS